MGIALETEKPGSIIMRELSARLMSKTCLAGLLGISFKRLNRIIDGTDQINFEIAKGLKEILGMSADFWIKLEVDYRFYLCEIEKSSVGKGCLCSNIAQIKGKKQ